MSRLGTHDLNDIIHDIPRDVFFDLFLSDFCLILAPFWSQFCFHFAFFPFNKSSFSSWGSREPLFIDFT